MAVYLGAQGVSSKIQRAWLLIFRQSINPPHIAARRMFRPD
jgi:hypothetical protein